MAVSEETIGRIVAILRADTTGLEKDLKRGQKAVRSFGDQARAALKSFGKAVMLYFSVRQVYLFIRSIVRAGMEVKRFQVAMEAATGSFKASELGLKFISNEADRLGFVFQDRVKDFKLLAAAAENTALQGEGTVELFKALTEASVALQLSSAETSGAILAVSQMMSKGKITAEELRLQLAERFPGAVRIMAESLGVTTKELDKMLERGELGIDALEGFAQRLRERFGKDAEKASKSFIGSANRMSTAWFKFKNFLFEDTGFGVALRFMMDNLAAGMNGFRVSVKQAGGVWEEFKNVIILNTAIIGEAIGYLHDRMQAFFENQQEVYSDMSSLMDEAGANISERTDRVAKDFESLGDRIKRKFLEVSESIGRLKPIIEDTAETEREFVEALGDAKPDPVAYQTAWEVINMEAEEGMNMFQIISRQQAEEYLMLSDVQRRGVSDFVANSRAAAIAVFGVNLDLNEKILQVHFATEEEKAKIAQMGSKAMIDNLSFAFKEAGKHSKAAFNAFKAVEIAKTIIETLDAAQGAYASLAWINPALGIAAAAAATVAGMARVNQIRNMTPGGAASLGGVGGGPTGIPTGPTPVDIESVTEREPSTQIIVQNPTLDSEDRLKDLMDKLRDFTQDLDIDTTATETAVT